MGKDETSWKGCTKRLDLFSLFFFLPFFLFFDWTFFVCSLSHRPHHFFSLFPTHSLPGTVFHFAKNELETKVRPRDSTEEANRERDVWKSGTESADKKERRRLFLRIDVPYFPSTDVFLTLSPLPFSCFPKNTQQRMSLVAVQDTLQTLQAVVDADVAANCVTVRGSAARNLHRLASSLAFAAELLAALAADASAPLRAATGAAYAKTLANYHTAFLRAGIRASTYLLPDRASFLRSLGETEASAMEEAEKRLVPALRAVVAAVEALFVGVAAMPVSEVRFLPSS